MRKFRAVFEKYDIEDNLLLYVLGYILYLRLFSFNDICKCLGSYCASFYVAFDKDTFYFVAPKLYVVIWRGRRFWGGHRFLRGPPVAWGATGGLWRIKTSLYISFEFWFSVVKTIIPSSVFVYKIQMNEKMATENLFFLKNHHWANNETREFWHISVRHSQTVLCFYWVPLYSYFPQA